MPELQIQPSINDFRSKALKALIERLAALHKSALPNLLIYNFDRAPESTLPYLAWQFDMLNKFWRLLNPTTAGQRELLKFGIPQHSRVGSVATLKKALRAAGYETSNLLEGETSWGGSTYPADQRWAVCRIFIEAIATSSATPYDIATQYPPRSVVTYNGLTFVSISTVAIGILPQAASLDDVTDIDSLTDVDHLVQYPWLLYSGGFMPLIATDEALIIEIFNFFKPERCKLDQVSFTYPGVLDVLRPPISDTVGFIDALPPITDTYAFGGQPMTDAYSLPLLYNKRHQYAGVTYAKQSIRVTDGASTLNGAAIEGNK